MKMSFAKLLPFVLCLLFGASPGGAAEITVSVLGKELVGGEYKIEIEGVLKLKKGEQYAGVISVKGDDFLPATWVAITPPERLDDGTFNDGSFRLFLSASVKGKYKAKCVMTYTDAKGKERTVAATKKITVE